MQWWEHKYCEEHLAKGKSLFAYTWAFRTHWDAPPQFVDYVIDLENMTQTNTQNGAWRRLLRFEDKDAHKKLSPFADKEIQPEVESAAQRLSAMILAAESPLAPQSPESP